MIIHNYNLRSVKVYNSKESKTITKTINAKLVSIFSKSIWLQENVQ